MLREGPALNAKKIAQNSRVEASNADNARNGPESKPSDTSQSVKISGDEGLAFAEELYKRGELDLAGAILIELRDSQTSNVDQKQVSFLLGLIAIEQENHAEAIEIFRKLLDDDPDLYRVRLELARALYEKGHDRAATYHFRLALAADLPNEAKQKIRAYLNLIEKRKVWRVEASIAAAPDSNVSAGPKDRTVELFGLPFELDESAREQSGLGLATSLSAQAFIKMGDNWRMETRAGGSATDYENIHYDDIFLFAEAGPRYEGDGFSISVLPAFSRRFFGGEGFSTSAGGRISIYKGLTSRTLLGLRLSGAHVRYDRDVLRTGPAYSAGLSIQHALDHTSALQAGVSITRERSKETALRNFQYGLNADYRRELPFGVTMQIGPDLYYRKFDSLDLLVNGIREDWTYGGTVALTKRDWRFYGFAPVFSYQFLKNESNSDRFNYDRHRANIGFTRTF